MLAWGGWRYDEKERKVTAPRQAYLTNSEAAVLVALLRAEGAILQKRLLAEAIVAAGTESTDPYNMVGMMTHSLNKKLCGNRPNGVVNVRGFGYRLVPIGNGPCDISDDVRAKIVALLVDELEATGPHARSVVAKIEAMIG